MSISQFVATGSEAGAGSHQTNIKQLKILSAFRDV